MDKYAKKGIKKLFSLTLTKIRLAKEADTLKARPAPIPLVLLFGDKAVSTVAECEEHVQRLREEADSDVDLDAAYTVMQLCDVIESVKYGFETADDMPQMTDEELSVIVEGCMGHGSPLKILLMTAETIPDSVYFGDDPPPGARKYSRVVSGVAPLLRYAYGSDYLSDGKKLKNVGVVCGRETVLSKAVSESLKALIA